MTSYIKKLIKNGFRKLGYEITDTKGKTYKRILPFATYSPWEIDTSFREIYERVKDHTLVDIYRCYELWQLVGESMKNEGALIEVGVWKGGTSALIAYRANQLDRNRRVYCCDTFKGVVKVTEKDSIYKGGEHKDTSRNIVENLFYHDFHLLNTEILEGIFPDETQQLVTDGKFTFCHIDVDVYQSAKDITNWIWDKMVVGGIVVYDDYGFDWCDGIIKFVDEERLLRDRIVLHNLNGHAIVMKIA